MIYLCDIDGTVADLSHRLHYIQSDTPDWDAFFDACYLDTPILETIFVIRALQKDGHTIIMVTGRSQRVQDETIAWLLNNKIPFSDLYMRADGDHRDDNEVKSELLDKLVTEYPDGVIAGVFEDRQQVVDMYRTRGLRVFQVAKGDF